MAAITVSGPPVERSEEILTDEALAFIAALHGRFGARRDELLEARQDRRAQITGSGRIDFRYETARVRTGDWRVAEVPADLRDRRVEITGPTERKMTINALNSGANVWLADLEDANTPHWTNVIGGQVNLHDAVTPDHRAHLPRGQGVPARRPGPDPGDRAAPAGLALRRGAPDHRGRAGGRGTGRLRPLPLPQRPRAARPRHRPLLLPAQARELPRGAIVERRVRVRAGGARAAERHHPGHRADRDDHRGLRDGRDPLRAARPHGRAQRGPLGLPVQHHQELPRCRPRLHSPRPQRGDHDGTDDEGLQRPARPDLPPARCVRHRRDGRLHPQPQGRRGQRARVRQGPRGQDPRGDARLRRLLGRPPRSGAGVPRDLRRRAGRRAQPGRPAPRPGAGHRQGPARGRGHSRSSAPRPGCAATSGSGSAISRPGSQATVRRRSTT